MLTQNTLRTREGKKYFLRIIAVDVNKCLNQIKTPISRFFCVPSSELESNIGENYFDMQCISLLYWTLCHLKSSCVVPLLTRVVFVFAIYIFIDPDNIDTPLRA